MIKKEAEKKRKKGETKIKEKKKRYAVLKHIVEEFSGEMGKERPRRTTISKIFEELYHYATRDQLTGVFNRRSLDEALTHEVMQALRAGMPLSAIMIDIDHFKEYNDRFGHHQGDIAIKSVTSIIQKRIREGDFAARYGGEEFVIVLPNSTVKQAKEIAERIRKEVMNAAIKPCRNDLPPGYEKVTISLGVASLQKEDGRNIMYDADKALYEAKRQGRNRVCAVYPGE